MPGRDPAIVQHGFPDGVPDEEREQENQADNRDVVRLRHDLPEVDIKRPENEEDRQTAEQSVADSVGRDPFALPDDQDERDHREPEEQLRPGERVDESLYNTHFWRSSQLGIKNLEFGIRERIPNSKFQIPNYSGPEMPPSFRTRQKWTAISTPMTSGRPTQCST